MNRFFKKRGNRKGQIAVEMLIFLAIALAILSIIISVSSKSMTSYSGQYKKSKAKAAVNDLSDAAEFVRMQGAGARAKVFVNVPAGMDAIQIGNSTLDFVITAGGDTADVYRTFDFDVQGALSEDEGSYWVYVTATDDYVLFSSNSSEVGVTESVCGNNVQETGEQCDGTDLGGQSCIGLGYDGGSLSCLGNCSYDKTGCTTEDTTPPGSVTGLNSPAQGIDWIYWSWTNPDDSDFSEVIIYVNATNIANTSNAYYNATGLIANTSYNLLLQTIDTNGNINDSDVEDINKTLENVTVQEESWSEVFFDDFNRGQIGSDWDETPNNGRWDIYEDDDYYWLHADNCDSPGAWILSKNISLAGNINATLTFDWEYENLDSDECLSLDLTDGTGWVEEVWVECSRKKNRDDSGSVSIDIQDFISLTDGFRIRFDCLCNKAKDDVFIDNVNVTAYG